MLIHINTSGAKQRLDEAHRVMGLPNLMNNQLEAVFNHWATVRISDQEVKGLI